MPPASDRRRLPALDLLRVASMILVVVVHAAMPYVHWKIRQLLWAMREPGPDLTFDLMTWWILGTALPVFFVLGGFSAESLRASRGWAGFVRDRWRRVGVPLIVAVPAVLLPTLVVWNYGWYAMGRTSEHQFLRFIAPDAITRANRVGPAHLWFLEYFAAWLAVYAILTRPGSLAIGRGPRRWAARLFASPAAPLLLAIPTTAILWANHQRHGLDAVMDMRNSFWINPTRWLHHGLFFWVGVGLARCRDPWSSLVARGPWYLALSLPAFAARAWTLEGDLRETLAGPEVWTLCAAAAAFGWLSTLGAIGCALRWWGRRDGPILRYLSDASFWVYLVHFPVVGLVQANLLHRDLPIPAKFATALGVGLAVSLLTYQVGVRHTAIGRWLHGPRDRGRGRGRTVRIDGRASERSGRAVAA